MGRSYKGYVLGGMITPFARHLRELEDALLALLRNRHYKQLSHSGQVAMRRKGLVPPGTMNAQPQVYSIWLRCKQWDTLWWQGGLSAQPYVLMAEFAVCESVQARFNNWRANVSAILRGKSGN